MLFLDVAMHDIDRFYAQLQIFLVLIVYNLELTPSQEHFIRPETFLTFQAKYEFHSLINFLSFSGISSFDIYLSTFM